MYEYRVLRFGAYEISNTIEAQLNQHARVGWRLISTDVDQHNVFFMYLERKIEK